MTVADQLLADFGSLTVAYDARVLRPRAWTIAQSIWCADLLRTLPDGPVLELCAGVGHIGLAAVADSRRALVLVDADPAACALARRNVAAADMANRVDVRQGRIGEVPAPTEKFALVIADPPWVRSDGIAGFPADPPMAIDGGADGLEIARRCCDAIDANLIDGGAAVLQLGSPDQANAIADHLAATSALRISESRSYDRGTLVHLSRPRVTCH